MYRVLWNITYTLCFRPFPTPLFRIWRITLLRLFGAKIENGAQVYSSARIWAPSHLIMEHGSCLGPNVICYNQATITLKKNAIVSQDTFLCTASHDTTKSNTAYEGLIIAPIIIGKDAWIGVRAYIGMGVEIGEHAIIGATASVYKDVDAWTVVGGNPAKIIKKRPENF